MADSESSWEQARRALARTFTSASQDGLSHPISRACAVLEELDGTVYSVAFVFARARLDRLQRKVHFSELTHAGMHPHEKGQVQRGMANNKASQQWQQGQSALPEHLRRLKIATMNLASKERPLNAIPLLGDGCERVFPLGALSVLDRDLESYVDGLRELADARAGAEDFASQAVEALVLRGEGGMAQW